MLIKPDIKDEKIIVCLQDNYGLDVENISFLPLGADFNTVVYKVVSTNKENYFLKLRSGEFLDASVLVPKYLLDAGIKQIILPITTKDGQLFSNFADFKTILYPYIDTCNATQIKLTKAQWVLLGKAIKKLHELDISSSITKNVSKENYSSKWRESLKELLVHISNKNFVEPVAREMSQFIKSKTNEIIKLIQCAEELVTKLQKQQLEYVLCHADLHGWNLIIDKEGNFYIVDWDTLIFAPKERDLMFIGAGIWDSSLTPNEEESLFYQGYAPNNINQDALAYYRFERIIQDISDYCEYVFLSDEGSKEDRRQCFEYLKSNFLEGGTIERAYKAYELTTLGSLNNLELISKRLLCKTLSMKYSKEICEHFTSKITTWMYPSAPKTPEQINKHILEQEEAISKEEELALVVLNKDSLEFLGYIALHKINTKTPEMGIWLKESAHNNGYGFEALSLLKKWANKNLSFDYLKYPVEKNNLASIALAKKLGGKIGDKYIKKSESGKLLDEFEYRIYKD